MYTSEGEFEKKSHEKDLDNNEHTPTQAFDSKVIDSHQLASFINNTEETKEMVYDSFDTYFFYSLMIIKKWLFIYPLYLDFLDFNRLQNIYTSGRQYIVSQDLGIGKKVIMIILMIPVGIILAIYALLLMIVILLLAIIGYISLILLIDLPFLITVSIQVVLLYLLICFPVAVTKEELSAEFLTSALWWIQLIWLLLFTLVMLQEIDDAMNSVIYISTFYNNKKLKNKKIFYFYTIVSCFPQMVQLMVTYVCASYASSLIFNNIDYLTPFLHFSGLFVILKIDSFIMGILKESELFMPPVNVFLEIEAMENEEEKKQASFLQLNLINQPFGKNEEQKEQEKSHQKEDDLKNNSKDLKRSDSEESWERRWVRIKEDQEKKGVEKKEDLFEEKNENKEEYKKEDEKKLIPSSKYSWYKIHFPSKHVLGFFDIKIQSQAGHFFFNNLQPTDPNLIDLVRLKYFLMGLGIFIIFAHVLKYCLEMVCKCSYY